MLVHIFDHRWRLKRCLDVRKHFVVVRNGPNVSKSHWYSVEPRRNRRWPVPVVEGNVPILVDSLRCKLFSLLGKWELFTYDRKGAGCEQLRAWLLEQQNERFGYSIFRGSIYYAAPFELCMYNFAINCSVAVHESDFDLVKKMRCLVKMASCEKLKTYFLRFLKRMVTGDSPIDGHIRTRVRFQVAKVESGHGFVQRNALEASESRSYIYTTG